MKNQIEKKDDKNSIKKNSMDIGDKSANPKKKVDVGENEFEEDRSMNLRMKPQPLKAIAKKKK
ncbi:MAG: hypothetical protein ABIQ40_17255 [Bacteroidia bacterium]